jgi:organic radical activating enzyme
MQNIVEIKQNLNKNLIRIGITLSNYCNFKCWYCWPGANEGTIKYPDLDVIVPNLAHFLEYYKKNTSKTKFDFNLAGGEPTNWKQFIPFVSYFKKNYDVKITVHTNGSRKLDWWDKAYPYLDNVAISVHHEFVDVNHVREVADFLYSKNVPVYAQVLMDPLHWDKCMAIVEELKKSKYHWSIRYNEVVHPTLTYTKEQQDVVNSVRARGQLWWWFLLHNRSYIIKTVIVDENNKSKTVSENHILLNKLNKFKGWQCNLGIDWINISSDGGITGYCPNKLFNIDTVYNLFDSDFKEKFNPVIAPVTCEQDACVCVLDTNMPKKKITNTITQKKIIPIRAI